jgi:WD40 repeat protein
MLHRRSRPWGSLIGMPACLPARLLGLLLLACILMPAGQAADPLWIVPASPGEELSTVAISHDGSTIVAGGDQLIALSHDGKKLWSAWSGTRIDMSDDGSYLVTSQGPTVRLFSGQGIMLWDQSAGSAITGISIAPDASMVAASAGSTVQSWYNSGAGLGRNVTGIVRDIRISPVKDQIIVATSSELQSFNLSYVPNWYDDTISPGSLAMSGDGTGIVIPNGNRIRMYHGSGTLLWERAYPGGSIIALAYSRDGSTIIAGRDDGTVLALDRAGEMLFSANAGYWATSVAVSDNGSTIATGSIDNQVRVFDREGSVLQEYRTANPVKSRSVAVSGDGSLVVAVDSSAVYGFYRSPSVAVVPSVPEGTGNVTNSTALGTATAVTTGTGPELTETGPVPRGGTTRSPGFFWMPAAGALVVVTAMRRR